MVFRGQDAPAKYFELYAGADDQWGVTDLMNAADVVAPADGPPQGYPFDGERTQHVVYASTLAGRPVYELWWDDGWQANDLGDKAAGAPAASGDPFGWQGAATSTQYVAYSAGGHVVLLARSLNGDWQPARDLTADYNLSLCVDDPIGYELSADGSQHIIFRDAEGFVFELASSNGRDWGVGNLTLESGAPNGPEERPADARLAAFGFGGGASQHVVYRSLDATLHQLRWDSAAGWRHRNVTEDTAGLVSQPRSAMFGYAFESHEPDQPSGTTHVMYVGVAGQIEELWSYDGLHWSANPITDTSPAHFPASTPTACVDVANSTQNVYFVATSGHIFQVHWSAH